MKKQFVAHLKKLDENKDGKLSKAEVNRPAMKIFNKVDTDKDGLVTEAEIKKAIKAHMEKFAKKAPKKAHGKKGSSPEAMKKQFVAHLKRLDANKDGKLSKAEVNRPAMKIFNKVDTDKDGLVTEAEIKKAMAAHMKKMAAKHKKGPKGKKGFKGPKGPHGKKAAHGKKKCSKGPKGKKGRRPGKKRPSPEERKKRFAAHMKKIDKDGDGKISKSEAPERLAKVFDKVDADKDGFVTPEEIKKSIRARMKKAAEKRKKAAKADKE
ncbi:MAG: EF-hand domain-containing protein [Planctomycetia bacterium]|jgi:Ca2+-binding EF-hand superfamily protein